MSSSPQSSNIEQPEYFEYRAARKLWISSILKSLSIEQLESFWISSAPKSENTEQPEDVEYRATRQVLISSSLKTLNIEQVKKFEYRAAWNVWISRSLKSLNIEQPEKIEYYRKAHKHWISGGLETLNIEQHEKFEYRAARAIRLPCCKTNFYGKQLPTKRRPRITKAQNQYWLYHPQVCFRCVTFTLPTSLHMHIA